MSPQVAHFGLVDPERGAEFLKPLPQARTLALAAPDADVHMVALRKQPGVAAADDPELDDGPTAEALPGEVLVADVPFEPDAVLVRREAERARRDPVCAVSADHYIGLEALAVERHRSRGIDAGHLRALPELGARSRRLLGEKRVEPAPLRHQHERLVRPTAPAAPVAEAELEGVDPVLDDGLNRERKLAHGPESQPAAAGLVPREPRAVDQAHARARAREAVGRRRASRPGADDDRVVARHERDRKPPLLGAETDSDKPTATIADPGVCPSGQRERAVNPSAQPTEVRILPPPSSPSEVRPLRGHDDFQRFCVSLDVGEPRPRRSGAAA